MARIPDDEIERLKPEVSLVRLVESSGVELKRIGKDWHDHHEYHEYGGRHPACVMKTLSWRAAR